MLFNFTIINFRDHILSIIVLKSNVPLEANPSAERSGIPSFYVLGGRIDTTNTTGLPDIQYHLTSFPIRSPPPFVQGIKGLNVALYRLSQDAPPLGTNLSDVCTIVVVYAIKPKSVGVIKLNGKTLEADITSGYLTNKDDTDTLLRGIRTIVNLSKSASLQKYGTRVFHIPLAECDALKYDSDEYWKCYISYVTFPGSHQVGTCQMGQHSKSVVDSQFRVYKTTGLRVIDCSV